ncbi:MAG: hypothetical protein M3464_15855 [Chloroflexota bacterium]|nr:hypothetical protein [Chloroflexota bacterium]
MRNSPETTSAKDPVVEMAVVPTSDQHAYQDDPSPVRQQQTRRRVTMLRSGNLVLLLAMIVGGLLAAFFVGIVAADDATPSAGHGHGAGHASGSPAADTPYADGYDPAAPIRALTPEEIARIERGEGAGFALPAELNGVPGPRHVLDLAHELGVSREQQTRVQAIFDEMRAAVIPAGARYLAALQALEADFRAGALTEQDLPGRVADVARREGELAAAHLLAHLQTARVLTPEQITAYNRLRGYVEGER